MSETMMVCHPAYMNNAAVDELLNGIAAGSNSMIDDVNGEAVRSCITKLTQALKVSKELTEGFHSFNNDKNHYQNVNINGNYMVGAASMMADNNFNNKNCIITSIQDITSHNNQEQREEGGMYVYRKFIRFPSIIDSYRNDEQFNHFCSAAIIFNIALIHHLCYPMDSSSGGSSDNDEDSIKNQHLRKAVKLYELAYNLMNTITTTTMTSLNNNKMSPDLFFMAIANNIAVAYQQLNEIEESTRMFQHLLLMIQSIRHDGHHGFDSSGGDHSNGTMNGILRNALSHVFQQWNRSLPAPAA